MILILNRPLDVQYLVTLDFWDLQIWGDRKVTFSLTFLIMWFTFVFFFIFFSRKGLMLQFTNLLSIPWIWLISISHEWCCNLSDLEMEYVEWHLKATMAGNSVQLFLTVMLLIMMNHYYSILSSYVTILVSQNILKQFLIFLFIT